MARRDPGRRPSRPPPRSQPPRSRLVETAELLERAYDREARIVALEVSDREAILRVLEDCPEELVSSPGIAPDALVGWQPLVRVRA